jgi:hypothetical protein
MSGTQPVALSDQIWTPCSPQALVLPFLRAEWDKWPQLTKLCDRRLITSPDVANSAENNTRAALLWMVRGSLFQRIPVSTEWFHVEHLTERHVWQLRAINHADWISPADCNELDKVALRSPQPLRGSVEALQPPILWGHDKNGPFTILEGNHRLTAVASSPQPFG